MLPQGSSRLTLIAANGVSFSQDIYYATAGIFPVSIYSETNQISPQGTLATASNSARIAFQLPHNGSVRDRVLKTFTHIRQQCAYVNPHSKLLDSLWCLSVAVAKVLASCDFPEVRAAQAPTLAATTYISTQSNNNAILSVHPKMNNAMKLELGYIDLVHNSLERVKITTITVSSDQDGPALYWKYPVVLTGATAGIRIKASMSGPGYVSPHEITYEYDPSKVNLPSESKTNILNQLNSMLDKMTR